MAVKVPFRIIKVADEVWLATAMLHRENPERVDFTVEEITRRAEREAIEGHLRPGVYVHAAQHCVANRPPNPGRYRMLYATGKNSRRLFRPGDRSDPRREGAKMVPDKDNVPARYRGVIEWYFSTYIARDPAGESPAREDPILALRGVGKHLARDEHPDEYVRRLREGWE